MISAADLSRKFQAHQLDAGSTGLVDAPMSDPFPSLTQDPFPPSHAPSSSDATSGPALPSQARLNGLQTKSQQPDFSSESAFPSLGAASNPTKGQWGGKGANNPTGNTSNRSAGSASTWSGSVPVIQRSVAQQSFTLALSGESVAKLSSVMSKVQNKYRGVKIEASTTRKAGTTTFVLKAADESVIKNAQRDITVSLARHVSVQVMIPASLRAHVIGSKGKNLKIITDQTGVKINIPPRDPSSNGDAAGPKDGDYDNDEQVPITIEGDEINVKQAQNMIQAIVAERTSKITQRLTHIDHVFYPFISGPKGANAQRLEAELGEGDVTVRIPPRAAFQQNKEAEFDAADPKRDRDLAIIVSGDREKVGQVVTEIESFVESMKGSFRTLAISIPKRQHRFLVGDAANDILASTGCSVELAAIDDPSDSVTIRGPQSQLPSALTAAMEKANAVRVEVIDIVALHRTNASDPIGHAKHVLRWLNVSGKIPKSQSVQVYLPRPNIVNSLGTAQIEIVGPDASQVAVLRSSVQDLVKSITPAQVRELSIDPLLHRFIIGKKGQGLKQYEAQGVDVLFPPTASNSDGDSRSDVLLVLSSADLPTDKKQRDSKASQVLDGIAQEIEESQVAAADMKSETLTVPAKLHRYILGPNGTTLNAVIGEERLVAVQVGSSKGSTNADDSITVRGPSSEVKRVVQELNRIAQEAEQDNIVNGHVAEFTVNSNHVPHLVGRGGSAVTKLREELGIRIDFGEAKEAEGKSSKKPAAATVNVVLTGRKENVEEAKKRLLSQVEKLADETSVTLNIPQEMHGSFIGQGGKYVSRLQDTYAVRINFPSANASAQAEVQKPDEVIIKGGKKGVEGAKSELLELLEYEKENNNVVNVTVSSRSIARIMGKAGATINQIRDETEAQVDVDRENDKKDGLTGIKLRGTKKAIAAAKKAIEAIASEVDGEETYTLIVAPEHHGLLIGPQGSNIRDLIIKAGGPEDAKTSSQYVQFPRRGDQNPSTVTIRAPATLAKRIRDELESAAKTLASRIVYGVVVAPQSQRMLIGRGGSRINELQAEHSVKVVFPGRREYSDVGEPVNKADLTTGDDTNIVKIVGAEERCKALAEEIKASFASVSRTMQVPRGAHAALATPQFFRQLRSDFGVSVTTPRLSTVSGKESSGTASEARIDDDVDTNAFELEEIASASSESIEWTMTGKDESSLDKAEKRITASLKNSSTASHQGRLWIAPTVVPRVIGKAGSGLARIQEESGASVDIPRDSNGLCVIRGSKDAVLHAKELIENVSMRA